MTEAGQAREALGVEQQSVLEVATGHERVAQALPAGVDWPLYQNAGDLLGIGCATDGFLGFDNKKKKQPKPKVVYVDESSESSSESEPEPEVRYVRRSRAKPRRARQRHITVDDGSDHDHVPRYQQQEHDGYERDAMGNVLW